MTPLDRASSLRMAADSQALRSCRILSGHVCASNASSANLIVRRGAQSQHAILVGDAHHAVAALEHGFWLRTYGNGCEVIPANVANQAGGRPNPETSIARRTQTPLSAQKCVWPVVGRQWTKRTPSNRTRPSVVASQR